MNIKKYLLRNKTIFYLRILTELHCFLIKCCKYLANSHQKNNLAFLHTNMLIRAHALEKGMSIGQMKVGFGKNKALSLIEDLDFYGNSVNNSLFTEECCAIINKYIEMNEALGVDMQDVKYSMNKLLKKYRITPTNYGGILELHHEDIRKKENGKFSIFSTSRFSCRDFSDTPIEYDLINKALKLCEKTPSACNRQGYRIHIYTEKEKRQQIFNLQKGCKGFSEQMQCAILICGDLNSYEFPELYLPYVDGGIYAMNLLYALHYYDLAAIPLTMGIKQKHLKQLVKVADIPNNEVPILLIGVGTFKDVYKVAESHRKPYHEYTTFH